MVAVNAEVKRHTKSGCGTINGSGVAIVEIVILTVLRVTYYKCVIIVVTRMAWSAGTM